MNREQMQQALAGLWNQHLPEIVERVAVLERACTALGSGSLDKEGRDAAILAAHKLAGVLGTFGRERGTELARELEAMFDGSKADAEQMRIRVKELREIVEL